MRKTIATLAATAILVGAGLFTAEAKPVGPPVRVGPGTLTADDRGYAEWDGDGRNDDPIDGYVRVGAGRSGAMESCVVEIHNDGNASRHQGKESCNQELAVNIYNDVVCRNFGTPCVANPSRPSIPRP